MEELLKELIDARELKEQLLYEQQLFVLRRKQLEVDYEKVNG